MKLLNLLSQILNLIQSSHWGHIVLWYFMYHITPLVQVIFQLSNLTREYYNLGFNSYYLTLLITMYASCRPPSHHTFLWNFHSEPFPKKCIILAMRLVCLISLPLLAIYKADFLSNIMICGCSVTTSDSLFRNSIFSILKYDRTIPAVNATFYSLYEPDWNTGPGKFVLWSICPYW